MTTTLLPLRPLPGPTTGALVAAHLDPRPCVTNPPQWWDTGDGNNHTAMTLCRTQCPLYNTGKCKPGPGEVGMIRNGDAYDHHGKVIDLAVKVFHHHDRIMAMRGQGMTYPQIARVIGVNAAAIQSYVDRFHSRVAEQHNRIAELVGQGRGWTDIAGEIHARPEAIRAYWTRYLQRAAKRRQTTLTRLPGVTDDSRNRPSDYREVVISMLTAPGRPYSHAQVAYVIGSTREAVRSYWNRSCREHHQPVQDTPAAHLAQVAA